MTKSVCDTNKDILDRQMGSKPTKWGPHTDARPRPQPLPPPSEPSSSPAAVRRLLQTGVTEPQGSTRFSSGSRAAPSLEAVTWIAPGSRTHAIASSVCSRSSTNWKASDWPREW
jgi:hypothetical protein